MPRAAKKCQREAPPRADSGGGREWLHVFSRNALLEPGNRRQGRPRERARRPVLGPAPRKTAGRDLRRPQPPRRGKCVSQKIMQSLAITSGKSPKRERFPSANAPGNPSARTPSSQGRLQEPLARPAFSEPDAPPKPALRSGRHRIPPALPRSRARSAPRPLRAGSLRGRPQSESARAGSASGASVRAQDRLSDWMPPKAPRGPARS